MVYGIYFLKKLLFIISVIDILDNEIYIMYAYILV